jgi:hypothetical protein
MPELETKQADVVTYARFESTDRTSADFNRKLNRYIYDNLPLTAEQKLEFGEREGGYPQIARKLDFEKPKSTPQKKRRKSENLNI